MEKSGFLELFADKYVERLVSSISAGVRDEPPPLGRREETTDPARASGSPVPAWTLVKTIELLCFCAQHHSFRIKYYVLRNNVVEKVLNLMQRREKYLVVASVRFLRACVGLKDEFYNRYIIKNNLFAPVMKVFMANGDKYNLLNTPSGADGVHPQTSCAIAHARELLHMFDSVTTWTRPLLKTKYEQRNQQEPGSAPSGEARARGPSARPGAGSGLSFASRKPSRRSRPSRARAGARRVHGQERGRLLNEDDDDDAAPRQRHASRCPTRSSFPWSTPRSRPRPADEPPGQEAPGEGARNAKRALAGKRRMPKTKRRASMARGRGSAAEAAAEDSPTETKPTDTEAKPPAEEQKTE